MAALAMEPTAVAYLTTYLECSTIQIATEDAVAQFTVRMRTLLVPPLVQPRLSLLPAGVRTATLKLPGAGIMEE